MATYEEVMTALQAADKAGATEDAQKLANIAHSMQSSQEKEQPKQEEKPIAERLFGEGTTRETPIGERISRVGKAGLAGGIVGAGIGAATGLAGGPAAPATVPVMAAGGFGVGAIGGMGSEIAEQASAAFGAGRGTQVVTGIAGGGVAGPAIAKSAGYLKYLGHLMPTRISRIPDAVKRIFNPELDPKILAHRQTGIQLAREEMGGKKALIGAKTVGEAIEAGVGKRIQSVKELAKGREEKLASELKDLRTQHVSTTNELAHTIDKGTGKAVSPDKLGTSIRTEIEGITDPLYKQRAKDYKIASEQAMTEAKKVESQGQFFGKTPEALEVKNKWDDIAKNSSEEIAKKIKSVTNDIWRKIPVKDEWGEIVSYKQSHLSAEGIDQIIRRLGEAGNKQAEGYSALWQNIAGELRKDLTQGIEGKGGFYDWSGLGKAKEGYKTASSALEKYESQKASGVLGKQEGIDLSKTDPRQLPKMLFGTEESFKEARSMMGIKKASEHAQQYVHNELQGKDVNSIRLWARDHIHLLEQEPEIRTTVQNQINKISNLQNKAQIISSRIEDTTGMTRGWSKSVDEFAKKWVTEMGVEGKGGLPVDHNAVVSSMLQGKFTAAQLKATAKYLTDNSVAREAFPKATAHYVSSLPLTGKGNIISEIERISPALEGSGLMSKAEIQSLKDGAEKIIKASKSIPEAKENIYDLAVKSFGLKKSLATQAIRPGIPTEKEKQRMERQRDLAKRNRDNEAKKREEQ